ncbi:hypothetical protein U9S86_004573 [Salmonella enterica]|nr:hypothetical protein [Salmonella enterica]EHA9546188.1 hypothetical protein [Salmonella enterica subsp. enterica serovar Braenderup]EHP7123060.1 hypothetical protein [Salmonella enterica subsp. enterica serovar Thompson]EBH4941569.1 hypothetical protein [Salmonella enterica]ECK3278493.1 hypothetical protein [Salmonella enterica]
MQTIRIKLTSTRPMLMHSDVLSDPLNPLTQKHKALTGKRKKTDEDYIEIAKSEWTSSLYYSPDIGIYLPSQNVEAAIREGAKLQKLGKAVIRAVEIDELEIPLQFTGPKDPEAMWNAGMYDARSVKVSTARLTRYRPIFKSWSCEFTLKFNEMVINEAEVMKALADAGEFCGVGDYRPKFGRFHAEKIK